MYIKKKGTIKRTLQVYIDQYAKEKQLDGWASQVTN